MINLNRIIKFKRMAGMTAMANADLSPTMEALEQEPSSGKEMVYLEKTHFSG